MYIIVYSRNKNWIIHKCNNVERYLNSRKWVKLRILIRLVRTDEFIRPKVIKDTCSILYNSRVDSKTLWSSAMHRIGEKSAVSREEESRVEEAASMGAGLITLMKEQLARERESRRAALVPLEIFFAAPPPFFILRGNKTRVVRAVWLISSRQFVKRAANKRDKNTREK